MAEQTNVKEELEKFSRLQELDSEIFELKKRSDQLPEEKKQIEDALQQKTAGMKNAEEELKKLQVARNEKENEMMALEEKIKKHEAELYQIKNNKEYTALQKEIDGIKADISVLEEQIIQMLDQIEEQGKMLEKEKEKFGQEKERADTRISGITSKKKEVDQKIKHLNSERKKFTEEIDEDLLGQYERILRNRGKTALSYVEGGRCSGCNMFLRPQVINDVRLKKRLVKCENCSRILYERGQDE